MERRLAAILAVDVVGYSRLMEADEAGTLAALKIRRKEVLKPLVAKHQGRIFKVAGDGVLMEFASAVNAVQCAVDLQDGMAAANSDQPQERRIVLRVGVNLGDVMVEGSDLYGDGVNIAARLESIAEPGGILVSGTAYDHVRNKVQAGFDDLGAQTLKNIAEPVRIYRVAGTPAVVVAAPKVTAEKPSIVVLPFVNMSSDLEQEYFADGMTEDILTELSRFKTLFVIARNSSFYYKGRSPRIQDVQRELGVRWIVEGSVRKVGNRVRITAQLIDGATGAHVWAERYDRTLEAIFEVQDEVVQAIVGTIPGHLGRLAVEHARRRPPPNLTAFDHMLRGRWALFHSADGLQLALGHLEKAIEADPNYAAAHAQIAAAYAYGIYALGLEPEIAIERACHHAARAVALDGGDTEVDAAAAAAYRGQNKNCPKSYAKAERIMNADP
jgi:TolB-like protein